MERFDPEEEVYMNCCIFGEPGAGKTRLCGTVCQSDIMGDVVWADIEGGMITLKNMDLKFHPFVEAISDIKELEQLYWALKNRAKDKELQDVGTLVIDNATDLVPIDLEHVVTRKADKDIKTKGKTRRTGVDDVWLDDRGETGRRLGRIFRWFRDLDLNVIMTAHPREIYERVTNADGKEVQGRLIDVRTEFPPALRRQVEGYQDYLWYLHYNQVTEQRNMLVERKGPYFAKTRGEKFRQLLGPMLSIPMDRPVIPELYQALQTGEFNATAYKPKEKKDGKKKKRRRQEGEGETGSGGGA